MAERPSVVECEVCGGPVEVGPRGPLPRRHRPVCPTSFTHDDEPDIEPGREVDPEVAVEPEPEPVVPGRPRLRQVSPIAWVDDAGRRYTADSNDGWPDAWDS